MIEGFRFLGEHLPPSAQRALADEVLALIADAPPYHALTPRTGRPMSVRMTNLGELGWISDIEGYRYSPLHPHTGRPWPAIPRSLMALWDDISGYRAPPQACLVNLYSGAARMGLHVDADESARDAPVLSISLGDRALFRLGGEARGDPTTSMRLASGDVVVLGGRARHAYHGVDRVYPGSSRLIPGGGRMNLTLRRVTLPEAA
jgi:alkylated DNA repair protein (DNA oxidative demethylase)